MNIFSRYKKPGGYIFMSKYCKYIIIKDNEFKILKTKRMTDLVKRELGVFDYRNYLFEEDLSIYLLVKDLSIYDDDTTIIYRGYLNDCDGVFNGTVIFTKMDELGYVSLSDNDVDLILKHLCKLPNGLFEMRYSIDNTYQSFDC
jgi:hypothetical protein